MKLLDRFKDAWAGFTGVTAGHPYARGFWSNWPDQNPFVPLSGSPDLTTSSLVMSCVNWTGTTLPSAPLLVQESKGVKVWETVEDHPLVQLMEDPNPFYSGITYWKAFSYWWLVYGNVYYYKARNAQGAVVELWQLDSRMVVPEWVVTPTTAKDIIYRYSGTGLPSEIPSTDLIHFRYGIDPNNHLLGLAPVRSMLLEIASDMEISNYTTQIMQNFGIPSFLVAPKPTADGIYHLSAEDLDSNIQRRTSGAFRGKPLVFNKPMDITSFGFSPDQMAVEKASRRPESRTCAVLGVPAIVLGFEVGLERSIYNNIKAAQEQAWANYIIPMQDYIAEVLEDQLLYEHIVTESGDWPGGDDENYRVLFDRSAVGALQEDRATLFTREIDAYRFGVKKRSEVRSALGLETDEATDDVYFIQPGQVADVGTPPAMPPPSKKDAHGEPSPEEIAKVIDWFDKYAPDNAQGLLQARKVQ